MPNLDQTLVAECRRGDRDAFTKIVQKYQTLVCSVAYGSTGNLMISEELAQETFVAAWRSIGELRQPERLRQWLCGIVRNLAKNSARATQRDVLSHASGSIQPETIDQRSVDPAMLSIQREEADMLDRTLAAMPETYREPLVLFYREQQSVARVAELLELTPEAVKQRLARGRTMLREEIATAVERGLQRSAPGRAFTIGVLAALPVMSGSAQAATITVTTAKGVSAMNAAGITGMLGAIVGPIVGLLGGWLGYSVSLRSARSERERQFIQRMTRWILVLIALMGIGITLIVACGNKLLTHSPWALATAIGLLSVGYVVALVTLILYGNRAIARIRKEDGTVDENPDVSAARVPSPLRLLQYPRHYDSKLRILGLPLISVCFHGASGPGENLSRKAAVGWIAIGDAAAYGILFASGSVAVGSIAVGAISLGGLSLGGLALGVLAMGGGAIGYAAIGGMAVGWLSFGGLAVAWKAALGGLAVSHEFAKGGVAISQASNTEAAKALVANSWFFRYGGWLMTPWAWWILVAIAMAPTVLAMKLVKTGQRKMTE